MKKLTPFWENLQSCGMSSWSHPTKDQNHFSQIRLNFDHSQLGNPAINNKIQFNSSSFRKETRNNGIYKLGNLNSHVNLNQVELVSKCKKINPELIPLRETAISASVGLSITHRARHSLCVTVTTLCDSSQHLAGNWMMEKTNKATCRQ